MKQSFDHHVSQHHGAWRTKLKVHSLWKENAINHCPFYVKFLLHFTLGGSVLRDKPLDVTTLGNPKGAMVIV